MSHHSTASNRQRAVFMRLRLELLPVPSPPSLALSSSTLTRLFRTGGEPILYAEPTNRYSAWRPRRRCMPPTGGIPQHHCHTAIPRVVCPVPRSLHRKRYKTLARRVSLCREAACARGVVIGRKTYRLSGLSAGSAFCRQLSLRPRRRGELLAGRHEELHPRLRKKRRSGLLPTTAQALQTATA
jgi:hypothetical protein